MYQTGMDPAARDVHQAPPWGGRPTQTHHKALWSHRCTGIPPSGNWSHMDVHRGPKTQGAGQSEKCWTLASQ